MPDGAPAAELTGCPTGDACWPKVGARAPPASIDSGPSAWPILDCGREETAIRASLVAKDLSSLMRSCLQ